MLLVGVLAWSAGVVEAAEPSGTELKVKQIRKWYAAIESDKTLQKVEIQAKTEESFNPKLTRYTSKGGEVKKLVVELQSDHGFSQESYYFHRGVLFFIYAVDEYWRFSGTGKEDQPDTIDIGSQQRYYFDGGTCIRALEKQAETKDASKLRSLLAQAKNKPMDVAVAAQDYQRRASNVLEIKSLKELEAFLAERFK